MAQNQLGSLGRRQITTDGCNIHWAVRARIVDPKPIHEERNCVSGPEMLKVKLPRPTAGADDDRPTLITGTVSIRGSDEIEDVSTAIEPRETHKLQSRRVQILWPAVQTCEANQIRRTLDQ